MPFLLILGVLLPVTDWLGHRWIFEPATLRSRDVFLSVTSPPKGADCCLLVTIDEGEFEKYLGEGLQPECLASVLSVILGYQPKVMVVDIDTSAPRFQCLEEWLKKPDNSSRIVWARVSQQEEKKAPAEGRRSFEWKVGGVLGGPPTRPDYGTPLFPQDPDWTVRGFQRYIQVDKDTPSLHWTILEAYCKDNKDPRCDKIANGIKNGAADKEAHKVRRFRTNWDFPSTPLSDLMAPWGDAKPQAKEVSDNVRSKCPESMAAAGIENHGEHRDKIVLLGAKFGDVHPTPFGPKLGIELVASAVETELAHDYDNAWIERTLKWTLKILFAFAIAWLNHRLMPLWATAGVFILLALAFLLSFSGIYYHLVGLEFLPFMIGMWIEQLIEGPVHASRLSQELREKIKRLHHDLKAAKEREEKAAAWAALYESLTTLLEELLHHDGGII